jgi:ABC-type cobalamin/Fe3+-siderophores transport system ATPase subunit
MSEPILSLSNLLLGYSQEKPVLHVEKVDIPRGKLVFLLGPSGIGKSTLLEFLGLMTDSCLNKNEGKYILRSGEGEDHDLLGISVYELDAQL